MPEPAFDKDSVPGDQLLGVARALNKLWPVKPPAWAAGIREAASAAKQLQQGQPSEAAAATAPAVPAAPAALAPAAADDAPAPAAALRAPAVILPALFVGDEVVLDTTVGKKLRGHRGRITKVMQKTVKVKITTGPKAGSEKSVNNAQCTRLADDPGPPITGAASSAPGPDEEGGDLDTDEERCMKALLDETQSQAAEALYSA